MPRHPLRPKLEPMMLARLRQIWIDHPDEVTRGVLREVARLHGVLRQIDQLSAVAGAVWLAERGGRLAALHNLNLLLECEPAVMEQKVRRGRGVAPIPAPVTQDDDDYEYPVTKLDGLQDADG